MCDFHKMIDGKTNYLLLNILICKTIFDVGARCANKPTFHCVILLRLLYDFVLTEREFDGTTFHFETQAFALISAAFLCRDHEFIDYL